MSGINIIIEEAEDSYKNSNNSNNNIIINNNFVINNNYLNSCYNLYNKYNNNLKKTPNKNKTKKVIINLNKNNNNDNKTNLKLNNTNNNNNKLNDLTIIHKSKITSLIEKYLNSPIKNNSNEIIKSKSVQTLDSISTINSSFMTYINNKIKINLYYTLNELYYQNIDLYINDNYDVISLISYAIDFINNDLIINKVYFKLINNENLYEIRLAKKNGKPNFDYPPLNLNTLAKNFIQERLVLVRKN